MTIEEQVKGIWKNSSPEARIRFDLSLLLLEMNTKVNKLENDIRRRDVVDFITVIIGLPIFGFLAYSIPFPITKVGVILAMIGFIWHMIKRRNHQKLKRPISPMTSFRDQLETQKINLQHEVRLLDTVVYWFLIPGYIPFAISILGLGDPAEYGWSNIFADQLLPMSWPFKIGNLIIALAIYMVLYWANQRVIKKRLYPMIKDIEKVQEQLENGI